jgi:outer membrane receptor protein involved in Fe transport
MAVISTAGRNLNYSNNTDFSQETRNDKKWNCYLPFHVTNFMNFKNFTNSMKILTILILTIFTCQAFAQENRQYSQGNNPSDGTITGTIIDPDGNFPVEYANIVIYRQRDSSLVNGTIANEKGAFIIEKMPYGKFYAVVSFIGYNKKKIADIFVKPPQININLGKIVLEKNIQAIGEVEVVADRKYVQYKIDKKVINVSQDISSTGGSAIDVLENTPSIKTDIDGNVSMRGSSNFKVLVDGKPSVLESSDILQQIPASTIENIEIITNPSAKYEPDGVSGIINIVTKKNKEKGFNGVLNANLGTFQNRGIDALLNYQSGKFTAFVSGGYSTNTMTRVGSTKRESFNDSTSFLIDKDIEQYRGHFRTNFKSGFDYSFNDKNIFSLSGELGVGGFKRGVFANTHNYTKPSSLDNYYISDNDMKMNHLFYIVNTNFIHKFKQKGHELFLNALLSVRDGGNENFIDETTTDANWNSISNEIFQNKSDNVMKNTNYETKLDYTKPLGEKGKFEAGFQYRDFHRTNEVNNYDFDYNNNDWIENDSLYDNITFDMDIQSTYATFSNQYKGFEFLMGLRSEYTYRNIVDKLGAEHIVDMLDFFPTFHLSKPIGKIFQVQASYSRRINRPHDYYLNPFVYYSDKYNARQGNPDLLPEFSDSYELNVQAKFEKSTISLETYRRQTNNLIDRVSQMNDNNVLIQTFENISRDLALGSELMFSHDFNKMWSINLSGNVFHYRIEGELYDTLIDNSKITWDTKFSNTLKFKTGTRIQLNAFYNAPKIEAFEEEEASYAIGIAVKQDFFKRKLTLTVNMRDIFNTSTHTERSWGKNYEMFTDLKGKYPVINFSLSYKINNYNQKREKKSDVDYGGEDM